MYRYKKIAVLTGLAVSLLVIAFAFYYRGAFSSTLLLTKTTFHQLPHWQEDNHEQALLAFQKSCVRILKRDANAFYSSLTQAGKVKNWQAICLEAKRLTSTNKISALQFFETWFTPYKVSHYFSSQGLFTGYYLPLLQGSYKKDGRYTTPIYGFPRDVVKVNLGAFLPEFSGKVVTARLKDGQLQPYPDRRAIIKGEIAHTAPVLIWGDNVIDIAFAHIQGSALVQLPDGQRILIGYAGGNGHAYTSIGRVLINRKLLRPEVVSMQTIKAWLREHPEQEDDILNENASYVFFEILKSKDPVGTQQVPLTPQRSLAVDTRYIPLGAPIWLETTVPVQNTAIQPMPYRRLLIAQDTGGNIKGVIRGDVYWGAGEEAEFSAGHMNSKGKYWVLLPRQPA